MNLRRLLSVLLLVGWLLTAACDEDGDFKQARAYVVTADSQLIGGAKAVGRQGDVILENDKIRVLINAHPTDPNTTRRGGAIVDADIQRFEHLPAPVTGGQDQLVEVLPIIDVKTFGIETITGSGPLLRVPQDAVEITRDGSDGGTAEVKVKGELSNILELFKLFPTPLTYLPVRAETVYRLAPGRSAVEITATFVLLNRDGSEPETLTEVPLRPLTKADNPFLSMITAEELGTALFFGASLDSFGPGVFGFSPEWYIEEAYRRGVSTFAEPIFMDWTAGVADEVAYGLVSPDAPLVFPILEDILTVAFQKIAEDGYARAKPGYTYSFTNYLVVDERDVAGVLDQVIDIKDWPSGTVSGSVIDETEGQAETDAHVIVFKHPRYVTGDLVPAPATYEEMNTYLASLERGFADAIRLIPYSRFRVDSGRFDTVPDANFSGRLPVDENGIEHYLLMAIGPGRTRGKLAPITVRANETTSLTLVLPETGEITFTVISLDENARNEPCKVTLFGTAKQARPDPFLGEGFLPSDEVAVLHTIDGTGRFRVPPGEYRLVAGRGPEYSVAVEVVSVGRRESRHVDLCIARVVDTTGWVAADLHMHTELSPDSGVPTSQRVLAGLVEGLDVIAGTDHDFISNYRPALEDLGGLDRLRTASGVELSQLQYGHFNSYPVKYDPTQVANGAPNWRQVSPTATYPDGAPLPSWTPRDVFDGLRAVGDRGLIDQDPIVVVNHPRESFTGYLRAFGFIQYYGTFGPPDILTLGDPVVNHGQFYSLDATPNFSWDFDALEIMNAKRFSDFRTATADDITEAAFGQPNPPEAPLLPILVRTGQEQVRISRGELLLDRTELGTVDDYLTLLAQGRRIAAVGNSDTHDTNKIEVGKVRTYVQSDVDDPRFIDWDEILTSLKAGRTIVTTGPFVEFWVDKTPIGGEVWAPTGEVEVRIRAQAPPWMSFDRIEIYGNGALIGEIGADSDPTLDLGCDTDGATIGGSDAVVRFDDAVACRVERDATIVVMGIGYEGMAPMSQNIEGPAVEFTDGLLLGVNQMLKEWLGVGNLIPLDSVVERNHPVYPFVVASAVWVDVDGFDADGDGYDYDGPGYLPGWFEEEDVPGTIQTAGLNERQQAAIAAAVSRTLSFTSGLQTPTAPAGVSSSADHDDEDDWEGGCGRASW